MILDFTTFHVDIFDCMEWKKLLLHFIFVSSPSYNCLIYHQHKGLDFTHLSYCNLQVGMDLVYYQLLLMLFL